MTDRFSAAARVLILVSVCTAPAFAAPATLEGAAQISQALQADVGATPGVIAVAPKGDAYELVIDLVPLTALATDTGATLTTTPMVMMVTDNGDGT